jgi:SAM-dependent methyltransferase
LSASLQRTWPLPALLVWALAWGLCVTLRQSQAPLWASLGLPAVLGLVLAQWPALAATRWRAVFVAAGFPLSVLLQGLVSGSMAAAGWVWLLPLALLLLAYPVRAWRDAPLFPTPAGALAELARHVALAPQAQVLDAGCGLGDGLRELRAAFPQAQLHGIEWSWPWALACRVRCPWATVRRGDLWAQDWAPFDLVYLFQRPESMPQAVDKARRELRPGAWLVSLEFEAPGLHPVASIPLSPQRRVWLYRMGPARGR